MHSAASADTPDNSINPPLTLLTTRYIKDQRFGLSALDPMTFTVALMVVSAMTLFAAWLLAHRASRVDPMEALRFD